MAAKKIELVSLDSDDDFETVAKPVQSTQTGPPPKKVAKVTARKTMSSFTPIEQIRKIKPDVIDLESEEEITEAKENGCSGPAPDKTVMTPNGNGTGLGAKPVEKPVSNSAFDLAIASLQEACKAHVNSVEYEKIKRKLDKKTAAIHNKDNARALIALIEKKSQSIQNNPKMAYTYLREVLDELTKHAVDKKAAAKSSGSTGSKTGISSQGGSTGSKTGISSPVAEGLESTNGATCNEDKVDIAKRMAHIKRLERALRDCGREIERLEESDLCLDDMDDADSAYVKVSRFQNRYMKIYRKIAQLKKLNANLKRKSDTKIKIETSLILEVNQKIQDLVNKKRQFPDFADIHGFYKEANEEQNLGMSKDLLYHEAKETFITVGKILKARRVHDHLDNIESYFAVGVKEEDLENATDPAEADQTLKSTLTTNQQEGKAKLDQLLDEYSRKQIEVKEEPEPVPDDEPEDVDNENNDDEVVDDHVSEDDDESAEAATDNQNTSQSAVVKEQQSLEKVGAGGEEDLEEEDIGDDNEVIELESSDDDSDSSSSEEEEEKNAEQVDGQAPEDGNSGQNGSAIKSEER